MLFPIVLVILGVALGCATIMFSVAFSLADKDKRRDSAYGFLISATATMCLSVAVSILAGRLL